MAEEPAVLIAARRIDEALRGFVHNRNEAKVSVVEVNKWGHLHAVVATHGFEDVPQHERQSLVWDHLRQRVSATDLAYLYRVDAMSACEYDAWAMRAVVDGLDTEIVQLGPSGQGESDE